MNTNTEKKIQPGKRLAPAPKKKQIKWDVEGARAALRWWVGTVVLTLFPTLTTVIVAALREDAEVTWKLIFNDGDLILSAFLIVTSTLIGCYNIKYKSFLTDIILDFLFGVDCIQLIIYTVFKTNAKNDLLTVGIISTASLFISIFSSWTWYLLTGKEV